MCLQKVWSFRIYLIGYTFYFCSASKQSVQVIVLFSVKKVKTMIFTMRSEFASSDASWFSCNKHVWDCQTWTIIQAGVPKSGYTEDYRHTVHYECIEDYGIDSKGQVSYESKLHLAFGMDRYGYTPPVFLCCLNINFILTYKQILNIVALSGYMTLCYI